MQKKKLVERGVVVLLRLLLWFLVVILSSCPFYDIVPLLSYSYVVLSFSILVLLLPHHPRPSLARSPCWLQACAPRVGVCLLTAMYHAIVQVPVMACVSCSRALSFSLRKRELVDEKPYAWLDYFARASPYSLAQCYPVIVPSVLLCIVARV